MIVGNLISIGMVLVGFLIVAISNVETWQHLAGAVSINLGATLGLLTYEGRRQKGYLSIDPLTGILIIYVVRRLVSLIYVLSERSLLVNEFLGQAEFLRVSSKAEFICLVGTLAFWIGWRIFGRPYWKESIQIIGTRVGDLQLLMGYILGCTVYFLELAYGEKLLSLGSLIIVTKGLGFGAIFALLAFSSRFGIGKKLWWIPLIMVIPLGADVLTQGMKSAFFFLMFPIVTAYFLRKPGVSLALVAVGTLVLMVFIYPYTLEFRKSVWVRGENVPVKSIVKDVAENINTYGVLSQVEDSFAHFQKRFGSIGMPGLVIHFSDIYGHMGIEFFENLVYSMIPRILWPNKPVIESGAWFSWYLGLARSPEEVRTSTAIHLAPELYWSAGWFAVVGWMLSLGVIYKKVHNYLLNHSLKKPILMAVWFSFFIFCVFVEERRVVTTVVAPLVFLVNGWIVNWVVSKAFPGKSVRKNRLFIGNTKSSPFGQL